MYFLGFLGGLIFHARPLLIFLRLFNLCCSSCWCHGRAVAFHTLTKVPLFFLMGLYMKQGARCQVSIHIDTQAQTCTQTNTDVLLSSWYFLGFFRGPNFSCAAPFNLSKKGVQVLCWCHGSALAFSHLNRGSIVF